MRTYELMLVVQPDLDEEGLTALMERITQTITDHGGEVIKVEPKGRRELAYPIRRHRSGQYVLLHAALEQTSMQELERTIKLSEDILRYLLVRLDET